MGTVSRQHALAIYPCLRKIASLRYDSDLEHGFPYQITPSDISQYFANRAEGKIQCDLSPNLFNALELYKQLVRSDYKDGRIDGQFKKIPSEFRLHSTYSAVSFYGADWTPPKRFEMFLKMHFGEILDLLNNVDIKFPRARAFAQSKFDELYTGSRPLTDDNTTRTYKSERRMMLEIAGELRRKDCHDLAEIVGGFATNARVKSVFGMPKDGGEEVAVTMPFRKVLSSVFFMVYPGAGQREFSAPKPGLPLRGWYAREKHIRQLRDYFSGRHLVASYDRFAYLLGYLFVKAFFRYGVKFDYKNFSRLVVIHEAIHYRNITNSSPVASDNPGKYLARYLELASKKAKGKMTLNEEIEYSTIQIHLLRSLLEKQLEIKAAAETGAVPWEAEDKYLLAEQLKTLVAEAQEYVVDEAAMTLVFGRKKLIPINYGTPFQMIINPNEPKIF